MTLSPADRIALHDLVCRYAARVDDRDFPAVAGLFAADAVLAMPDPPGSLAPASEHTGRAAVETALTALDGIPLTCHGVLGAVFDPGPAPGTATGRTTGVAHHLTRRGDSTADLVWQLHYHDRYTRVAGRWQFARREVHIDFIETRGVRRSRIDGDNDAP